MFLNPFRAGDDEDDQNNMNTVIVTVWTENEWFFCSSAWRYERQGALQTDLPNGCVSITWQSLSMLWQSAREHCDGADGARHAHKFYSSVQISYKILISDCRGDSDLGLCRSWHLANRILQRSGRICFQQANRRNSEPIRALHSGIILARCQELHRRQACSPLQIVIMIRNLHDIHTKKYLHIKAYSADRDRNWNWVKNWFVRGNRDLVCKKSWYPSRP